MVKPIWKCLVKGCGFTASPTEEGFNEIVGHQLHHSRSGIPKEKRGFYLVDEKTGELLARTLRKARDKGLLTPEKVAAPPLDGIKEEAFLLGFDDGYDKGYDDGYKIGSEETEAAIQEIPFDIWLREYNIGIKGHVGNLFRREEGDTETKAVFKRMPQLFVASFFRD